MKKLLFILVMICLFVVFPLLVNNAFAATTIVVKVDGVEVYTQTLPDDASLVVVEKIQTVTTTVPVNP
jgi:hypothetical protein